MMYLRFITCLTVGLFGVSLVLMTVYDSLFQDWDVVKDVRLWAARVARKHRTRYTMMDEDRMNVARAYAAKPNPQHQVALRRIDTSDPVASGDLAGV